MALNNEHLNISAVQRALAIPEILSQVFACFYSYDKRSCSQLLSCALVSKLWFSEAMRWLWRNPMPCHSPSTCRDVLDLLDKIPEARRNIYATYIKIATLKDYCRKPDGLDTVQFPSLQQVRIWKFWDPFNFEEIKFQNNSVRTICTIVHCHSDAEGHATAHFERYITPLQSHFNHLREWHIFAGSGINSFVIFRFTQGIEGQGWEGFNCTYRGRLLETQSTEVKLE